MNELKFQKAYLNEWTMTPNKIKVLLLSIHYPLAMKSYFERALLRRDDIDLITTGPYTGAFIPWLGGMTLPSKYAIPPTLPLPFPPNVGRVDYSLVKAQLPQGWKPDLVLCVDAGISWNHRPTDGYVAHVATDPHCLVYDVQRSKSDKFFNMQRCYSKPGDVYLPYAYDPAAHYPMDGKIRQFDATDTIDWEHLSDKAPYVEKDTDAVLIGMPYEKRTQWVNALRRHGVSVLFENGPIFDEYRDVNNRAHIGMNWSSMDDLNARAFELPAMRLAPVMNIVPDMHEFFTEGKDFLGFKTMEEAVEKVLYLKQHPEEVTRFAESAYQAVLPHTYDERVNFLLKECRLI